MGYNGTSESKMRLTSKQRRERLKLITADWSVCEHLCPKHGKWSHKVPIELVCTRKWLVADCFDCVELDTRDFNRRLVVAGAKQYPSLVGKNVARLLKQEDKK